jgi:bifunctional DNA-binding transcriptional regulator/antitoxin component of YhaV-PrlF toxin-antitoxin module
MGLESTIGVAKTGTNSVRTTVPEGITEFLGVKAGDKLDWRMHVDDGERAAIVTKRSDKNNQAVELSRYSMRHKRGRKVDGDI